MAANDGSFTHVSRVAAVALIVCESAQRGARARGVLVGEVWLASANEHGMESRAANDAEREIAAATWRRFACSRKRLASREPSRLGGGQWRACTPDTAHDFSAVGYSLRASSIASSRCRPSSTRHGRHPIEA